MRNKWIKVLSFLYLLTSLAYASPVVISFDGFLSESAKGDLKNDKVVTFTIASGADILNNNNGTTLWEEQQTVSFINGYFETELGRSTALDSSVFSNTNLSVLIRIDGISGIVSVPFRHVPLAVRSLYADHANSVTANLIKGVLPSANISGSYPGITSVGTLSTTLNVNSGLKVKTDALVVDAASKYVGIGVSNPGYELEIDGTLKLRSGQIIFQDDTTLDSAALLSLGKQLDSSTSVSLNADTNVNGVGQIEFYTSGVQKMVVSNLGGVGIGTTQPVAYMDVNGAIRIGSSLYESNEAPGTIRYAGGEFLGKNGTEWVKLDAQAGSSAGWFRELGDDKIVLETITNKVGIGVVDPQTKLEVSGEVSANTFLGAFSGDGSQITNLNAASISGVVGISAGGTGTSNISTGWLYKLPGGGIKGLSALSQGQIYYAEDSSQIPSPVTLTPGQGIDITNQKGVLTFSLSDITFPISIQGVTTDITTPAGENLVLSSGSGKIGIGKTSPLVELDVSGAIRISDTIQEQPGTIRYSVNRDRFEAYTLGSGWQVLNSTSNTLGGWTEAVDNGFVHLKTGVSRVGLGTTLPLEVLDVSGAIKVGYNTISSQAGVFRFNPTTSHFEGYTGTTWNRLDVQLTETKGELLSYMDTNDILIGRSSPNLPVPRTLQGVHGIQFEVTDEDVIFSLTDLDQPLVISGVTYDIKTTGNESLVLSPGSGYVGIGVSLPAVALDVSGALRLKEASQNLDGSLQFKNGRFLGYTPDKGWIPLGVDGVSESGWVQDANNGQIYTDLNLTKVGIATQNAVVALDVNGAIRVGTTTEEYAGVIRFNPSNENFEGFNGTEWQKLDLQSADGLWVQSNINSNNVYLSDGTRVGIGTTQPEQALVVAGGIQVGDTLTDTTGAIRFSNGKFQGFDGINWLYFGLAVSNNILDVSQELVSLNGTVKFAARSGIPQAGEIRYANGHFSGFNGIDWNDLDVQSADGAWQVDADNSNYLTSDPNYAVGIGKVPSPGYKLDVNGVIHATGLEINGQNAVTWIPDSTGISYLAGSIGVGVTSDARALLRIAPGSITTAAILLDRSDDLVAIPVPGAIEYVGNFFLTDANSNRYQIASTTGDQTFENKTIRSSVLTDSTISGNFTLANATVFDFTGNSFAISGNEWGIDALGSATLASLGVSTINIAGGGLSISSEGNLQLFSSENLVLIPSVNKNVEVSLGSTNKFNVSDILTADGNTSRVGVGNTNPQFALDVNGEVNATGFVVNGVAAGFWNRTNDHMFWEETVAIGTSNSVARLTIDGAGVSAPVAIVANNLLGSTVSGTIENDGNYLYYTDSANIRYAIVSAGKSQTLSSKLLTSGTIATNNAQGTWTLADALLITGNASTLGIQSNTWRVSSEGKANFSSAEIGGVGYAQNAITLNSGILSISSTDTINFQQAYFVVSSNESVDIHTASGKTISIGDFDFTGVTINVGQNSNGYIVAPSGYGINIEGVMFKDGTISGFDKIVASVVTTNKLVAPSGQTLSFQGFSVDNKHLYGGITVDAQILVGGDVMITQNTITTLEDELNINATTYTSIEGIRFDSGVVTGPVGADLTINAADVSRKVIVEGVNFINGIASANIGFQTGKLYMRDNLLSSFGGELLIEPGSASAVVMSGNIIIDHARFSYDSSTGTQIVSSSNLPIVIEGVSFENSAMYDVASLSVTQSAIVSANIGRLVIDSVTWDNNVITANTGDIALQAPSGYIKLGNYFGVTSNKITGLLDGSVQLTAKTGSPLIVEGVYFDGGVVTGAASIQTQALSSPTGDDLLVQNFLKIKQSGELEGLTDAVITINSTGAAGKVVIEDISFKDGTISGLNLTSLTNLNVDTLTVNDNGSGTLYLHDNTLESTAGSVVITANGSVSVEETLFNGSTLRGPDTADLEILPGTGQKVVIAGVEFQSGAILNLASTFTAATIDNISLDGNTIKSTSGSLIVSANAGNAVTVNQSLGFRETTTTINVKALNRDLKIEGTSGYLLKFGNFSFSGNTITANGEISFSGVTANSGSLTADSVTAGSLNLSGTSILNSTGIIQIGTDGDGYGINLENMWVVTDNKIVGPTSVNGYLDMGASDKTFYLEGVGFKNGTAVSINSLKADTSSDLTITTNTAANNVWVKSVRINDQLVSGNYLTLAGIGAIQSVSGSSVTINTYSMPLVTSGNGLVASGVFGVGTDITASTSPSLIWNPKTSVFRVGTISNASSWSVSNSGTYSSVLGGSDNRVSGSKSGVVVGDSNVVSGNTSLIAAGSSNLIYTGASDSGIGGGNSNLIGAVSGSFLGAGNNNSILGTRSFIGAGTSNTINATIDSAILAGASNKISASSSYAFIGAGALNNVVSDYSFIGAGYDNQVLDTAGSYSYSAILAGQSNQVDALRSFVGAGQANTISGTGSDSSVLAGTDNIITNSSASIILGGAHNRISNSVRSFALGNNANVVNASSLSSGVFGIDVTANTGGVFIIGANVSANVAGIYMNADSSTQLEPRSSLGEVSIQSREGLYLKSNAGDAYFAAGSSFVSMNNTLVRVESTFVTVNATSTINIVAPSVNIDSEYIEMPSLVADNTGQPLYWLNGMITRDGSSLRYKKDVKELNESIDTSRIYDLRPVTFTYISTDQSTFGLIAEEVSTIFPELTIYDDQGRPDGVKYRLLSVLMLQELKKLKTSQDENSKRMEELASENAQLKADIEAIKAHIGM